MPATGKFRPDWPPRFGRASFAVTARRSGQASKVFRRVADFENRGGASRAFRGSSKAKESVRSRQSMSIKCAGCRENLRQLLSEGVVRAVWIQTVQIHLSSIAHFRTAAKLVSGREF